MALSDYNPVIQWYADALTDLDEPTGTTKSNPGSTGNPTIAGTTDQYADFDSTAPGDAVLFAPSAAVGNVGTGDMTVVLKACVDTWTAFFVLFQNYNGSGSSGSSHGFEIYCNSGASRGLRIYPPPRANSFGFDTGASNLPAAGTDFILAFRRQSGSWSAWVDADASGGMSSITGSTDNFGSSAISSCGDVTFGNNRTGGSGVNFDGRLYWLVWFNTAISDADLQLSAWDTESNLKSAWASAPAGAAFAQIRGRGTPGVRLGGSSFGQGW